MPHDLETLRLGREPSQGKTADRKVLVIDDNQTLEIQGVTTDAFFVGKASPEENLPQVIEGDVFRGELTSGRLTIRLKDVAATSAKDASTATVGQRFGIDLMKSLASKGKKSQEKWLSAYNFLYLVSHLASNDNQTENQTEGDRFSQILERAGRIKFFNPGNFNDPLKEIYNNLSSGKKLEDLGMTANDVRIATVAIFYGILSSQQN